MPRLSGGAEETGAEAHVPGQQLGHLAPTGETRGGGKLGRHQLTLVFVCDVVFVYLCVSVLVSLCVIIMVVIGCIS